MTEIAKPQVSATLNKTSSGTSLSFIGGRGSTLTRVNRRVKITRTEELGLAYERYSSDEQNSLAEQHSINEGLAADEGIKLVGHFFDEGLSRDLSERPGLLEMFAYLEEHPEIGFIVVNELERLTAGVAQRADITALCKRAQVTIVEEQEGRIDPHDEQAMQNADERAVKAKAEVIKVRRRTKRNMRAKVVTNKTSVALRPPYGIRMKPLVLEDGTVLPSGARYIDEKGRKVTSGQIELHPDEHPWLLKIFEWAHAGKSLESIARELNGLDVRTKTGRNQWSPTVVGQILENPLYKGEMTWGKRQTLRDEHGKKYLEERDPSDPGRATFPSPLGAIINPKVWDEIEDRRRAMAGTRPNRNRMTIERRVLDHFVFCGRCGRKMYGRFDNPRSEGRSWRYNCDGKRPGAAPLEGFVGCTTTNSILEKNIFAAMAGMPTSMRGKKPELLHITVQKGGLPGENLDLKRRQIEAKIAKANKKISNAEDLAIDGEISKEKLRATREECSATITTAEKELAELGQTSVLRMVPFHGTVATQFAEVAELIADESISVEVRRDYLANLGLERVYVDSPGVRLHLRD